MTRRVLESQFVRFCAVGASGYAVNLAVYAELLAAGLHYLAAAAIAFLVAAGAGHLGGQAVAIVLATPFSFAANKLWAFAEPSFGELQPLPLTARDRDR